MRVGVLCHYGEGDALPAFDCGCAAPVCWGTVRSADHRASFVGRYDDHLSDCVRWSRAG